MRPLAVRREPPSAGRRVAAVLVLLLLATGGCADTGSSDDGPAEPPEEPAEPRPEPEPEAGSGPREEEVGPTPDVEPDPEPSLGEHGVSAGDGAAVEAGMRALAAGGTAVDAAIAAAFAVSVVEPFASGIGGGGAALVVEVDGTARAYDYREVVEQGGEIPASNTGIPGFVAGMARLHDEHGALDWPELVAAAIDLADQGVPASGIVAAQLTSAAHRLPVDELPEFYPDGSPLAEGDELRQPELAETLRAIAADGSPALYGGALGDTLVDAVDGIDAASLDAYAVQEGEPARGGFAGHEIVAAAPPLPGAALIQLLQVAESLDIGSVAPGSADHVHRLAMAWRVADRSVRDLFGDPDFTDVPVAELTDPAANATIAATIPPDALLAHATSPAGVLAHADAGNTTHITTVDDDGTVVSMTNTLTNFWGSGQRVAGFFLNDQLSRFSVGGGDANVPEPGRRSVSWSLPLVVLDGEQRPVLGLGSPGGRRIPTIEAGVLVRWALHGATLADAVEAPRFHLEDDVLQFEELPDDEVAADLRARGYADLEVPAPVYHFGSVQALEVDHEAGTVTGARDPRREGDWDSSTR